ncbi:MAG: enoyl-CoA hydratase-related protein [Actinomycetota bacterium]
MSDSDRVATEVRGNTLIITMTRQDKRNAIDGEMTLALDAALNRLDDDDDLWVGVLTGGLDMFCAGTDMANTSGTPTERGGIYGVVGRSRTTPLIAAVEGVAYGGGFEVVMACDLVVAASNARLALPEVKRGLVASSGALLRAQRVLPLNIAKQLLMTGDDLPIADAARLGLVNVVAEPGAALEQALALADRITTNSPVAVQYSLQAIDRVVSADDEAGWEISNWARDANRRTADAKEGVAAFFEKRPPRWTGR